MRRASVPSPTNQELAVRSKYRGCNQHDEAKNKVAIH